MLALARSFSGVADLEPQLCFKLVRGAEFSGQLRAQCEAAGVPFEVAPRSSVALWKNIHWAEVVHCHNASPDVVLASRLLRRPLVLTMVNHRSENSSLHSRLWAWGARQADARCYISDFVRRTWEPEGLRPNSRVMPAVSQLPELPVTWKREGFFFLARWIANKGIEQLLEAYATAQIEHAHWPLTLAGDGPLRPWVEEFIARHGLQTVRQPGFVSEEEKFALMGHAKWNVAPPNTQEDLGLTPIEARHLAVPSIITRDGGVPEAAGPYALVAEPGDVGTLRARLEEASRMPEEEYRHRALDSQTQLRQFLRPLSDYHALYRTVATRPR
jgi:glycosyltransferase involved in cell wall biosynthesis